MSELDRRNIFDQNQLNFFSFGFINKFATHMFFWYHNDCLRDLVFQRILVILVSYRRFLLFFISTDYVIFYSVFLLSFDVLAISRIFSIV